MSESATDSAPPENLAPAESDDDVVAAGGKPKPATAARTYPRRTIEAALAVPTALKDNNGGNPWSTAETATALGVAKTNNNFFYLAASSRTYGFTQGGRNSAEISLLDRGRSVLYPSTPAERDQALLDAFFSVEVFAQVVKHYGGSKLPDEPFRTNALTKTFDIDESYVPEFIEIFEANCRFLGIGNDYGAAGSGPASGTMSSPTETIASPAKAKGVDTLVCFVAMPFSEKSDRYPIGFFDEVMKSLFTPAIVAAGFEARTAKRQGSDVIQSTIINDLLDADLVLADLTEHNPNVLFELGMRMNADRPVALVRAKGTGAIFDVDHMLRVEDYNPNLWKTTVERDIASLSAHIKAAWEDRESSQTYLKILKGSTTP